MVNDVLDRTFSALSDPTRRAILRTLSGGTRTVSELRAPFDISMPAVTKHLHVLERAGLITRTRQGREKHVELVAKPLRAAGDWIDHYRRFWETRLDSLGDFLGETKKPKPSTRRKKEPRS